MSVIQRLNAALSGRYHVERKLGEGGMARVYLAHDEKHDRYVAIKVLKPELAAEVDAERFLAEIRTTANLQHPHVLPLFDSGKVEDLLFYVMPYVRGESLRAQLRRQGALRPEEAVRIAASLGDALDHAHRQGVLHRDIKPANVLMSDGAPLLADFGIGLAMEALDDERMTLTGASVGTPGYMSPEQAAGERTLDAKSDIYALGALTYEMLTGGAPFADLSPRAALAKVLTETPPEPAAVDPRIPIEVSDEVARALATEPGDRHPSAGAFAEALRAASRSAVGAAGRRRKALWPAVALTAVATLVVVGGMWTARARQERWARTEALPEVERLLSAGERAEAFALSRQALEVLPDDPVLTDLYASVAIPMSFTSDPPGARVEYRPFDPEDTAWVDAGTTPVSVDVPFEELLIRFDLDGYRRYLAALTPIRGSLGAHLRPLDSDGMILQPGGSFSGTGDAVAVDTFWMDEFEVTNREYADFLEEAATWDSALWVEPFSQEGVAVDLDRMRATLVDRTGRPGPAGWELSDYPEGRGSFPVQGVSWFEALAYCAFRGKRLPTYFHWKVADGGATTPWDGLLQHANLADGSGPVPVGTTQAYSPTGVADLAGNVREWVWNASDGDRYILGGAWESPPHMYTDFDAADPWSRSLENGIRCARYDATDPAVRDPVVRPIFDFSGFEPVDDATFATLAAFYDYDRGPLGESRTVVDETEAWVRELVEVDAAYLDERLPIHVFLPKGVEPPYQTVVYFPGSAASFLSSSTNISEMAELMFIPQSGRALLYPVIKGMYERRHERPSRGMTELRQRYVWMVQDIMRTVDLIEERPDLSEDAAAYLGLSLGAEFAVPVALEKRFDTAVLIGGALDPAWRGSVPDAAAPWNFVSRITVPTLLVNGRYDFMHPYEESQVPFFEMIAVPDDQKEFVVLPTGHLPPNNEVIRHTLRWLDARLGPVPRVSR